MCGKSEKDACISIILLLMGLCMGVVLGGALFHLKSIRRKSTKAVANKIEDTSFGCQLTVAGAAIFD